jgi:hypothetical protein
LFQHRDGKAPAREPQGGRYAAYPAAGDENRLFSGV